MQSISCIILKGIAEHLKLLMDNRKIKHSNSCCPSDIILEYINIRLKWIYPKPRKVEKSKELKDRINNKNFIIDDKTVDENTANEIIELINHFTKKFEQGDDLNNHLNRQIFQSENFDTLLNIWNIKHLHLNKKEVNSKTAMKSNRSDWLLFFIVDNDNVYFIDVLQHPKREEFIKYNFLKTIFNNDWINLSGFKEISEAISENDSLNITDDKKIYEFYKNKINIITFKFNDKIYGKIGNNIACSGDKILSIYILNEFKKKLNNIFKENYYQESIFKLDKDSLLCTIKTQQTISQNSTKHKNITYTIIFNNQNIFILDKNKNKIFEYKFI